MWNRSDEGRRRGDARAGYYCCLLLSVIIKSLLITSYCADTWHSCLPYTFVWRLKASPGNITVLVWTRCCVLTYREVILFVLAVTTFYAFLTRVSCNWSVAKRFMWLFARIFRLQKSSTWVFNPLNPELNPICYLLALLGAHHFLHVSRIRGKLLTFRLLMSYIYGAPILDVSRSHTTTQHSRIPPGAWIFVCCECRVLSGRGLCDELITRPEESYRLCCVSCVWSRNIKNGCSIYIYDISRLSVNYGFPH